MHICLSFAHYLDANLPEMISTSEKCQRLMMGSQTPHTRAYAHYSIGLAHYLQNNLESAEHYLLKVMDDRYSLNPAYLADSGYMLVCIYLAQGRDAKAVQMMEQLGKFCRKYNHTRAGDFFQAFEAEYALRCGDIRRAHQICRFANFDAGLPRWFFYVPQFTPIKCLLAKGSPEHLEEALARLTKWNEEMEKINRINIRIEISVLLTVLHKMRKEDAAAMECLQTALDLAEPGGWIRTFVDAGPPMERTLEPAKPRICPYCSGSMPPGNPKKCAHRTRRRDDARTRQ
jgi:LuxR family maltose regulon positive regulatory protein